ncbi:MAG TPA: RCC1 domain-containing protein [Methylomirabilota bacterium]|nr:RCC1 domain-containing protein [Methylomirabilota bacterium]
MIIFIRMNVKQYFAVILLLLQIVAVQAATTVTNISAGYYHSMFLKSNGSLWMMGYNLYGELGDGTFNQTNRPEQIISRAHLINRACDFCH